MPRNSGGTYTLPAGNPVVSGTLVASTWANPTMGDLGNEMTDSLSRTGNGGMLAPLRHIDGSESGPAITYINDPTSGRYLVNAGEYRDSVTATDVVAYTPTAVDFLVPVTQNGSPITKGKNLLINGGFDVWQRGTFLNGAVNGDYVADRWLALNYTGVNTDIFRITDSIGVSSCQANSNTTTTGYFGFEQKVEVFKYLSLKTMTASLWMRSNNPNARIRVNVTGGTVQSEAHTGGGGWERLVLTFTLPDLSAATAFGFQALVFDDGNVPISSGDFIEVKEVQLEIGSIATAFEQRFIGEELVLCQRYYQNIGGLDFTFPTNGQANFFSITVNHITSMRVQPAITDYTFNISSGGGTIDSTAVTQSTESTRVTVQTNTASGTRAGTTAGRLKLDAEL